MLNTDKFFRKSVSQVRVLGSWGCYSLNTKFIARHFSCSAFINVPQEVRGTHDILPNSDMMKHFDFIEQKARLVAKKFNMSRIETPILEFSSLYNKTLGETSDIVHKELFMIQKREGYREENNESDICLRPEGTAGVIRAFMNSSLIFNTPQKLYYMGPMFRHERPQKGRYRQFHQFGVEMIGYSHIHSDVDAISMAYEFLLSLGLKEKITLQINTIGNHNERESYINALREYFQKHKKQLSPRSQARIDNGSILRILDSSSFSDGQYIFHAPKIHDYISNESMRRFEGVLEALSWLDIPYVVNPYLVRGLDYYCGTIFEFLDSNYTSAKKTLIGGGRYDGIEKMMGTNKAVSGIGWAAGLERLSLSLEAFNVNIQPEVKTTIAVLPIRNQIYSSIHVRENILKELNLSHKKEKVESKRNIQRLHQTCLKISKQLRDMGFIVDTTSHKGSLSKQLTGCHSRGVNICIIIGENELEEMSASVRTVGSGAVKVSIEDIPRQLVETFGATRVSEDVPLTKLEI